MTEINEVVLFIIDNIIYFCLKLFRSHMNYVKGYIMN